MTLRRKSTKKGGCEYANVSDNYNLLNDAIKQVKTGGCRSYADVNSSYMLTETKTGGGRRKGGSDLLSMSNSLLKTTNDLISKQGGRKNKKGGSDLLSMSNSLLKSTNDLISKQGGCACSGSKGGAVELAPFAAAVALMGARYFSEFNNETKPSSSRRKSSSKRKA